MRIIKKHKALISVALIIMFISVVVYVLSNNDEIMVLPDVSEEVHTQTKTDEKTQTQVIDDAEDVIIDEAALSDKESTIEEKVYESEEKVDEITDKEQTCTISVRCDTILKNVEVLDAEKVELIPKDGIIYAEKTVTFNDGESVFDLLVREMNLNKIHLEFVETPIYKSAYIEGIANIYEFDCGELSGWMYRVNGWFPNYGCSQYKLKPGDKVEWIYTCDLGKDIGGEYSARNGR